MQGRYNLNKINNNKYLIEYGYESFCPLEIGCIDLKYISNKTALFSLDNYIYFELDSYYNDKTEYNRLVKYIFKSIWTICKEQSIKHLTIQIKDNRHLLEINKILSNKEMIHSINNKGDVINMLDRHIIKETRMYLERIGYFVLAINDDHFLISDLDDDKLQYKLYPHMKCECCSAPLMTRYGDLIDHFTCSNFDCIANHTTLEDYKEWEAESVLGLVED